MLGELYDLAADPAFEERFNRELRSFLKKVGITSQREIEKAVWSGTDRSGSVTARVHLSIEALGVDVVIEDEIGLD